VSKGSESGLLRVSLTGDRGASPAGTVDEWVDVALGIIVSASERTKDADVSRPLLLEQ
jgi:hypothetical protein